MAHAGTTNALVTGGARRIGREIVVDLARHDIGVAIHCHRSRAEADELAAEIRGQGGRAVVVEADLADTEAAEGLVRRAEEAIGPLSILVNNASIFESDTAEEFDWETWDQHFAIHVKAPAALTRALAASCGGTREGLVVNVIDQRVWRPTPRYFSYTLSKSALWMATRTMAQTFAPTIRVNAIGPGPAFPNARQDEAAFSAQVAGVILGRGPAMGEFGATIRYLWSARSVTGQMIALDGGQHLAWQTPDVAGIAE